MTLNDIVMNVLQNTQWPTDTQTSEDLKPIITPFVNDGYREVCERYRPFRTAEVLLSDGCFDVLSLKPCVRRILGVTPPGSRTSLYIDTPEQKNIVRVYGFDGDTVQVRYEYIPDDLLDDAAIPIIPSAYHSILVDYATFKYLMTGDLTSQAKGGIWKQSFDRGLSRLVAEFNIPAQKRIVGMYTV